MKQDDFIRPLIHALAEFGGKAERAEVQNKVQKLVQLDDEDKVKLADGTPRWQKHLDFAVLKLRGDLIVSSDKSSEGVWELTDEGQSYAETVREHYLDSG